MKIKIASAIAATAVGLLLCFFATCSTTILTRVIPVARGDSRLQTEEKPDENSEEKAKPEELPLKPARTIEFDTDEGTWMSLDVSPDGKQIVFDLLGDIYLLPMGGGQARPITSGMAWDCQPRFSPDGRLIAFISDRHGNDNVWVMNADGSDPRPITKDKKSSHGSPAWSPDGSYILARRWGEYPQAGALRKVELWLFHKDGGSGVQITKGDDRVTIAASPTFSPDGRYIYFSSHSGRFQYNVDLGRFQVNRFNRETGEIETVTSEYGGGLRPLLSPNGRLMAYATRHDAKTGLRLRDLESRTERWLAYPIQRDEQEGFAVEDLLPGYSFTPDGKFIVIGYGGKIHKIDIETKKDTVVPFAAHVKQELGPFVYVTDKIGGGDLPVRQIRWPTQSPDGKKLVFGAVGKIWIMDLPDGKPRPLTNNDRHAYAPSFSPDGKHIVYVTWSDRDGGRIWKVPVDGGAPAMLTPAAAYYTNPSWSPEGDKIVFVMGSARGWLSADSSDVMELRWIAAAGGPSHEITTVRRSNLRPTFSADGQRVFYTDVQRPTGPPPQAADPKTVLHSIRLDGVDKKTHLQFEDIVEAVPAPDGQWVVFGHGGNLYLAALPKAGGEPVAISTEKPSVPVRQLTTEGGLYTDWRDGGKTITWGFTNRYYRIAREEALRVPAQEKKAEAQGEKNGRKKEELRPETFEINLSVPRPVPQGKLALRGARIITMKGDEVIQKGDIVIENNRIAAVGPSGKVKIPADASVINVAGKTIVPGLVDIHAHMRPQPDVFPDRIWSYAANLAYGVTTSRDPSHASEQIFPYAEMVEVGDLLGPRIYSTGTAMTTRAVKIDSYEDAKHHVRRYKQQGADFLKQYMQPRRIQRQWIIMAAKEEGINVTAEGGGELKLDLSMVLDGYTGFEHSLPVTPVYKDVIELIARAKTYYTPTLIVSYGGYWGQYYFRQATNIHEDKKLMRFTPHEVIDRKARRRQLLLEEEYHFPEVARGVAEIQRRGGNVCLGAHGEQQGLGAHWELWMLASGGMTPMQALRAATLTGAEGLGLQKDLGSIEPGKLADLIVLNRNPLDNIRHSADILYVMKNGELMNGDTLDQIWPRQRPFPKFFWQAEDEELNSRPK